MSDDKQRGAVHLSANDFAATLNNKQGLPVFVDFFAQWCGPCKMAAPVVDKLADEYRQKIIIAKLDVDENNQTATKYGVMSIPTVIIFKNGEEVDRTIGFPGEAGFVQMIEKNLKE
ncbi:thioredoxin [Patescibacteria group bacterium]|nr:thioredoxin [Patescibacteria group bacterium]MBU1967087.1 thioredoxin [Patescibacteria group bacterium]MBU2543261.1 thioredoxin [Patescibacteria group bacterium]